MLNKINNKKPLLSSNGFDFYLLKIANRTAKSGMFRDIREGNTNFAKTSPALRKLIPSRKDVTKIIRIIITVIIIADHM